MFELEPNIQLNEELIKKEGFINADETKSNEDKHQQRTSTTKTDEPTVWHYDSASSDDDDFSCDDEDNIEMGLRNDSYFLNKNEHIDYSSLMNKKNWISGDILWHYLPKNCSISFFKARLFEVT